MTESTATQRVIEAWNPPIDWVKEQIEKAGTTIGSVHFKKRENGELRKMSYRLHVRKPSFAKQPKNIETTKEVCECGKDKGSGFDKCSVGPFTIVRCSNNSGKLNKKIIDKANNLITVLDCNKVTKDEKGNKHRGAWRSIPLEAVTRIKNKEVEIVVNRY